MANEAVLRIEKSLPIPFTISDGTAVAKGALLTLSSPMTASAATADGYVAGIAAQEKIANNGITSIAIYRDGIFLMYCSAAITAGQAVAMTGSGNKVKPATAADAGGKTLGIALSSTTSDGDTLLVELKPACNNNAYS
jgi:hypothetical protein